MLAMSFFYVVSQTCFSFFIPLFLHDAFGCKPQRIGVWLTLTSLGVFVIQVWNSAERPSGL